MSCIASARRFLEQTVTERELPLFPLEQVVLFPGMPLPLRVFEERYKVMIGACQVTDQTFGVVLIRAGREVGEPAEPERVGCTARMLRIDRLPDGQMNILSVGEQRFRLLRPARVMPEGYLMGDVELLSETTAAVPDDLIQSLGDEFRTLRGGSSGQVRAAARSTSARAAEGSRAAVVPYRRHACASIRASGSSCSSSTTSPRACRPSWSC